MEVATDYKDPDGVDPWRVQRVRRLARQGLTVERIATMLKMHSQHVRRWLSQPPAYERCPTCGGLVRRPCRACELRAGIAAGRR